MTNNNNINDDLVGDEANLTIPVYIENDIDTDEEGNTIIQTFLYANRDSADEEGSEVAVTLNALIENTISYYVEEKSSDSANALYVLANDLSRQAEALRDKADYMDRGLYSDDMFVEKYSDN
tara:strand:- start:8 stop:373 length:366 start_codon:yes stop_codon:yes gene_type:complete